MEDEDMKKETQNLAYPPAFKLEVALFAKKHSQYAAAKIFNVARRRIFDWMRQIPKLEELIAKGHMKKMTGRGPKNRDIDQALYTWYCERQGRNSQLKLSKIKSFNDIIKFDGSLINYGYLFFNSDVSSLWSISTFIYQKVSFAFYIFIIYDQTRVSYCFLPVFLFYWQNN